MIALRRRVVMSSNLQFYSLTPHSSTCLRNYAKKLMVLMGLGVKCGDTVTVNISGSDEEAAEKGIKEFLEANL